MDLNTDNPDDEPTEEEREEYELAGLMNEYAQVFNELCQDRHEEGAARYGVTTFLGNDIVKMMAEELADTANYCKMQFVKLMILNNMLVDKLEGEGFQPEKEDLKEGFGMQAFKGTKDVGWGK